MTCSNDPHILNYYKLCDGDSILVSIMCWSRHSVSCYGRFPYVGITVKFPFILTSSSSREKGKADYIEAQTFLNYNDWVCWDHQQSSWLFLDAITVLNALGVAHNEMILPLNSLYLCLRGNQEANWLEGLGIRRPWRLLVLCLTSWVWFSLLFHQLLAGKIDWEQSDIRKCSIYKCKDC